MIDGIAGDKALSKLPNHIAVIGNSVPRRCGIATFTTDTVDALRARFPEMRVDLYAMDDGCDNLVYPAGVTTIPQHDPASYIAAPRPLEAAGPQEIGRASRRERGCQDVEIPVVAGTLK